MSTGLKAAAADLDICFRTGPDQAILPFAERGQKINMKDHIAT
jgi:hypothetical protein